MDYLKNLNERQKEAILQTDGPLLILAGAGSGKTMVVTRKIAYLINEKNVNPYNVLAITFTNKAANEMKERVQNYVNTNVEQMWIGTFHSICVRILRRYINKLGYNNNFSIYDRDDQITLIRECLKELNLSRDNYRENGVLSFIGRLKDQMTEPDEFIKANYKDFRLRNIGEIYELYQKKLKEYNALDFDDLLIKTVELLEQEEDILNRYSEQFKYIFVDEYQDTNKVQYLLVKLLSSHWRNITAVGDSDQSIYSWRGADIRNIRDFEKDYKDAEIIMLEQNYRSSQNILDLANKVIKNNPNRKDKKLWSEKKQGHEIIYSELLDERDETQYIISEIEKLKAKGHKYEDFAILYRTNAQSRAFEEALMAKSIPYKIVGGLRFYDRMEIKDIIAYLNLIINPQDNLSLRRVINTPRRGIGDATLENLEAFAERLGTSVFESLDKLDMLELTKRARNGVEKFKNIYEGLDYENSSIEELIKEIVERSGYVKTLEESDTIEDQTRIENIREFMSVVSDFEMHNPEGNLEDFLADVALLSDVDKTEDTDENVTLMTLHAAKGLEYPVIFMVGMEEGLFPSFRSIEDDEDLEEERRLCYVGITRAEEKLYLTGGKTRTLYGKTQYAKASRFIIEMGNLIEKETTENTQLTEVIDLTTRKKNRPSRISVEDLSGQRSPKAQNTGDIKFNTGDKVRHKKWGLGTIVQIKNIEHNDQELTIAFDDVGLRRLLKSIAPINKVEW